MRTKCFISMVPQNSAHIQYVYIIVGKGIGRQVRGYGIVVEVTAFNIFYLLPPCSLNEKQGMVIEARVHEACTHFEPIQYIVGR